jgi:uncharacterized membrane protein YgcG
MGLVILALVFAVAPVIVAQHVPQLESAITDQVGALEGQESAVEDALQRLFDRSGVQLYVLFVESTGGMSIGEYAIAVGDESLAGDDALLAVALGDRTVNLSVGPELRQRVSQVELDRVRTQVLQPGLAEGDFAGAVIDTAAALAPVLAPPAVATPAGPTPGAATSGPATPSATPVSPGTTTGGGIDLFGLLLVLAGVGLVIWFIARVRRLRSERGEYLREAGIQEQLGRQANAMLIQADDALRDGEQELGFAEAEFGAQQTERLRSALEGAKGELQGAFVIGQKLDDAEPETPDQRRQMIEQIIARCQKVLATVEAQQTSISQLRELEKNAPAVLARLSEDAAKVEASIAAAAPAEATLARYADSEVAAVSGNLAAARQKVDDARRKIDAGRAAIENEDRAAAAVAARQAQDGLADAASLVEGVTHLATSLDQLAGQLKSALAAATTNVESARAAVASGQSAQLGEALVQAEQALAEARRLADQPQPNVEEALRRATDAHEQANRVLGGVRQAQEVQQRTQQSARSAIAAAEASVMRASDYISGYRRTRPISRAARNRLVEAERAIAQAHALLSQDPGQALAYARQADQHAADAYNLALAEAPRYDQTMPTQQPGADIGSLVIGAILGGMLGGGGGPFPGTSPRGGRGGRGGRRGSGWGGGDSGWGGGFGSSGGFGGSSSGGFGSGGFGGGRGSSGGFGGGRSSSGRF